jgi:ribosomal protein L37AE/L43A
MGFNPYRKFVARRADYVFVVAATGGRRRAVAVGSAGLRMGLWDGGFGVVELRRIQPYEATKTYICPGCHQPRSRRESATSWRCRPTRPTCVATGTRRAGTGGLRTPTRRPRCAHR